MTYVTKPFLPPLSDLEPYLKQIWETKTLSNGGPLHQQLEEALQTSLGVPHVSLFCNATVALIVAQKALGVAGEVITTPYSFVATAQSIMWAGNTPVFVDVEPDTLTIDPDKVEAAVTERTTAIMPLHCYGNTCDVAELQALADRRRIKLIYDACHSFGVEDDGGSVLRHGDVSVVSFHATKVFNTFEGGMVVSQNAETKKKIDHLKNFGFVDETTVSESGINGKMSEFNAAVGLTQLNYVPQIFEARKSVDSLYRDLLEPVPGITTLIIARQTRRNYSYFPIFVGPEYGVSRDELYEALRIAGVYGRRYFYPLIPEFEPYRSAAPLDTSEYPNALAASRKVICLPLYPDLPLEEVRRICGIIAEASRRPKQV